MPGPGWDTPPWNYFMLPITAVLFQLPHVQMSAVKMFMHLTINLLPGTNYTSSTQLIAELLSCLTAFSTTKHTYSRSVRSSDSFLRQELGAWGRLQDLSQHNWCGCVVEAPRALAPTGPLTKQMCPKNFVLNTLRYYRQAINESMKYVNICFTSITSGIDFSGVRAPCRNRTCTSLSS